MTYPTSAIIFTATLGATREPRSWYLAAHRAESRESISVSLTGEEAVHVLSIESVRAQLRGLGVALSGYTKDNDLVAQLTQRVAELQAIVDRERSPDASQQRERLWDLFDKNMRFEHIREEIVRLQQQDTNIQRVIAGWGSVSVPEAIATALKQPTLVDALSWIAIWDTERTVRQALRNVGPDNRKETGHGGLWETTFKLLFEQVLEQWHPTVGEYQETAEHLWQLLDDIDTLGDAIKPSDPAGFRAYYRQAGVIAARRHEFLKSDGHKLTVPNGRKISKAASDAALDASFSGKSSYAFIGAAEYDPAIYAKYEDLKRVIELALSGDEGMANFPGHADLARRVGSASAERYHDLVKTVESSLAGDRCATSYASHAAIGHRIMATKTASPVPMLLFCPMCHTKHIDEGEFATKPHHTHACQGLVRNEEYDEKHGKVMRRCGHVWRPAIVPTIGVEALPGFINAQ